MYILCLLEYYHIGNIFNFINSFIIHVYSESFYSSSYLTKNNIALIKISSKSKICVLYFNILTTVNKKSIQVCMAANLHRIL